MVFRAYFDDSYNPNGYFVLGGHIASAATWDVFSSEWTEMLQFIIPDKTGRRSFKLNEMQESEHRAQFIPVFLRLIDRHNVVPASIVFKISDIQLAIDRLFTPGIDVDWHHFRQPFFLAFRLLMETLHRDMPKLKAYVGTTEAIEFIFDEQFRQEDTITREWDNFVKNMPLDIRDRFVNKPTFADDKKTIPLQAADLWAGFIRQTFESGSINTNRFVHRPGWEGFDNIKNSVQILLTADKIAWFFAKLLRGKQPYMFIYDSAHYH